MCVCVCVYECCLCAYLGTQILGYYSIRRNKLAGLDEPELRAAILQAFKKTYDPDGTLIVPLKVGVGELEVCRCFGFQLVERVCCLCCSSVFAQVHLFLFLPILLLLPGNNNNSVTMPVSLGLLLRLWAFEIISAAASSLSRKDSFLKAHRLHNNTELSALLEDF